MKEELREKKINKKDKKWLSEVVTELPFLLGKLREMQESWTKNSLA